MRWLLTAVSFFVACPLHAQFHLSGSIVNTTQPDHPIAGAIRFVVEGNVCTVKMSSTLAGDGSCTIKELGGKSNRIEIVSSGPPLIEWSGNLKGNFATGTYRVPLLHQFGSFYLALIFTQSVDKASNSSKPRSDLGSGNPRIYCSPAIESAVDGELQGWDGETIFKLDNGQIWQQAEYDYTYFYEYHPDVTIYQTSGGCRMKVDGEDDTVIVKRIK